jgi:hypothetical protein
MKRTGDDHVVIGVSLDDTHLRKIGDQARGGLEITAVLMDLLISLLIVLPYPTPVQQSALQFLNDFATEAEAESAGPCLLQKLG